MMRIRITFSKDSFLTYTSHLDLARVWERALRRAGLPVAHTGGFNPRPRLQLAAALPLGHSGAAEWLDVWLERRVPVSDIGQSLAPVLPEGLGVSQVVLVPVKAPALQTQIAAAEYQVCVEWEEPEAQVAARIEGLLAAEGIAQERRGKRYDLRPLVEGLWLERVCTREVVLGMRLAARPGATARPERVLGALGMDRGWARFHRRKLIVS